MNSYFARIRCRNCGQVLSFEIAVDESTSRVHGCDRTQLIAQLGPGHWSVGQECPACKEMVVTQAGGQGQPLPSVQS